MKKYDRKRVLYQIRLVQFWLYACIGLIVTDEKHKLIAKSR